MNVIFYVMDCLRADHLGINGYRRDTTPVLDRLAREGVNFTTAYAQSGWTAPSAASMFSSQHPSRTGIHKMRDALNADMPWLPETLTKNGWLAAGFSSMYQVSKLRGFDRGFTDFYDLFKDADMIAKCKARGQDARGDDYCLPLSEDLHERALAWLDAHKDSYDPWFWLIWSIDTHEPFRQPESFNTDADSNYKGPVDGRGRPFSRVRNERDRQHLIDLYDGSLRYQDAKLGELVAELEKRGVLDETLIIVMGDHGEMFWEHGVAGHGKFPWEQELRVPLIMRCPQVLPMGKRIDSVVQLIDVAPTIVELAGLPPETGFRGKSLKPLIDGEKESVHEAVVLEVPFPFAREEMARVVRKGDWKYVEYRLPTLNRRLKKMLKEWGRALTTIVRPGMAAILYGHLWRRGFVGFLKAGYVEPWLYLFGRPVKRLYDLKTDPREDHDKSRSHPERVKELAAYAAAVDSMAAGKASTLEGLSAAEQERKIEEHLRELGYVED